MPEGIYVWGTGCGAGELLARLPENIRITAYVDSFPSGESFMGSPVILPSELALREPELIIVTARKSEEILARCAELGIERERLLFTKNNIGTRDINISYDRAEAILGAELVRELKAKCLIVREPMLDYGGALTERELENDYVRIKTLAAVCRELETVEGAAAELGVYKGAFARCINRLMPERKLYLFDTFSGFDEGELKREKSLGRCGDGFAEAHKNTALEKVLSQMPHRESVIPMAGLFPASLNGLEERFAFVSLDADLEESTYAGLEYFVPRLNEGGYIFLHDCNSPELHGVRAALRRYESDCKTRLHIMPLCDVNGTMVICG